MSKVTKHVIVGDSRKEKFDIVRWHFDQCKELGCGQDYSAEGNLAWVNEKLITATGELRASLLESQKRWQETIQRRRR